MHSRGWLRDCAVLGFCCGALVLSRVAAAQLPVEVEAAATRNNAVVSAEEMRHATPEWQMIAEHLPDPAASAEQRLELTADVLRARKFPDEALAYYHSALDRGGGGDASVLLNKIGVTELELQMTSLARLDLQRSIKLNKKNAEAWNALGSVECVQGNYGIAVDHFKKAVSLNKKSANFHANLGNAYVQEKDFSRARKEFQLAVRLDPHVFDYHGIGGMSIQLQSPADRGRFYYERARLYVERGDEAEAMHHLGMSAEAGFDVLSAMRGDALMAKYRKDPRVLLMAKNGKSLHQENALYRSGDRLPALGASETQ